MKTTEELEARLELANVRIGEQWSRAEEWRDVAERAERARDDWRTKCLKALGERDDAVNSRESIRDANNYLVKQRDEARAQLAALQSERKTIESLACMLGWGNVPPREVLERSVNALRSRAERAEAAVVAQRLRADKAERLLVEVETEADPAGTQRTVVELRGQVDALSVLVVDTDARLAKVMASNEKACVQNAELKAQLAKCREALEDAAKSLESIWAGRAELSPEDTSDARWQVRQYAKSRADVAHAALAPGPQAEPPTRLLSYTQQVLPNGETHQWTAPMAEPARATAADFARLQEIHDEAVKSIAENDALRLQLGLSADVSKKAGEPLCRHGTPWVECPSLACALPSGAEPAEKEGT